MVACLATALEAVDAHCGAGRGAALGSLTFPRVGLAFPVGSRRSGLVWRDWACRAGASSLVHKLCLLLLRTFSHAPYCFRLIRVAGHLVLHCSAPRRTSAATK